MAPPYLPLIASCGLLFVMVSISAAQITSMLVLGRPEIILNQAVSNDKNKVVRLDPFSSNLIEDIVNRPGQEAFTLTTIQVGCAEMDSSMLRSGFGAGPVTATPTNPSATGSNCGPGENHNGYELGFHGLYPPDLTVGTSSTGGKPYDFFVHGPSSTPFLPLAETRISSPPQAADKFSTRGPRVTHYTSRWTGNSYSKP